MRSPAAPNAAHLDKVAGTDRAVATSSTSAKPVDRPLPIPQTETPTATAVQLFATASSRWPTPMAINAPKSRFRRPTRSDHAKPKGSTTVPMTTGTAKIAAAAEDRPPPSDDASSGVANIGAPAVASSSAATSNKPNIGWRQMGSVRRRMPDSTPGEPLPVALVRTRQRGEHPPTFAALRPKPEQGDPARRPRCPGRALPPQAPLRIGAGPRVDPPVPSHGLPPARTDPVHVPGPLPEPPKRHTRPKTAPKVPPSPHSPAG